MAQVKYTGTGVQVRESVTDPWVPYFNEKTMDGVVELAIKDSAQKLWQKSILEQIGMAMDVTKQTRSVIAENIEKIILDNAKCCGARGCLVGNLQDYIKQLKAGV